MSVSNKTTGISKEDVIKFSALCTHARAIYTHYKTLFDPEFGAGHIDLLEKVAPIFFRDLGRTLIEQIILQSCKITDQEKDVRGNLNLTIAYFLNNADFSTEPENAERLQELSEQIHEFRKKIKPARDKIISHPDRNTILNGTPLGGVNKDRWNDFWLNLQDFVEILYHRYCGLRGFYICAIGKSDAALLINALEERA